jgi:hypothetical protein
VEEPAGKKAMDEASHMEPATFASKAVSAFRAQLLSEGWFSGRERGFHFPCPVELLVSFLGSG